MSGQELDCCMVILSTTLFSCSSCIVQQANSITAYYSTKVSSLDLSETGLAGQVLPVTHV